MNEHKNPPKTIEEVGIHIGYMSDNITEIKDLLKDTPTQKAFDELEGRVKDIEDDLDTKYLSKSMFKISLGTVTTIIAIVVGLFTILGYIK